MELLECEDANMMIAEYMNLANRIVAKKMKQSGFAYLRCQEYPDEYKKEKLDKFLKQIN